MISAAGTAVEDPPPANRRLAGMLGGALAALYLTTALTLYRPIVRDGNQYDDAYITYRYAANLASGKGLVFNEYERVNSASSLLYTLLLSGCYAAGLTNLERWSTIINLACGAGLILVLCRFIHAATRRAWWVVVFAGPLCISGSLTGWAVSGMETIFFSFLVVAFLYLYFGARRPLGAAVVMAAGVLTRPEGLLLLTSIVAAELLQWWRTGRPPATTARSSVAAGLLAVTAYLGFNMLYYSEALPHSLIFKRVASYYSMGYVLEFLSVENFYWNYFPLFLLLGAGLAIPALRSLRAAHPRSAFDAHLATACAVYILLSFASFVAGPHSDMHRYTVHIVPVLVLASCLSWAVLEARWRPPRAWAVAALVFVVVFGSYRAWLNQRDMCKWLLKDSRHQVARKEVGAWIRDHVPQHQWIISADLGAIAYLALDHRFIDALGLTTRQAVEAASSDRWPRFLHWVSARRPAFAADTVYPDGELYALSILRRPWKVFKSLRPPDDARLQNGYDLGLQTLPVLDLSVRSLGYRVTRLEWEGREESIVKSRQ